MHGEQPHHCLDLAAQTALFRYVELGINRFLVIAQGQNKTHQINLKDTCAIDSITKQIMFVKKKRKVINFTQFKLILAGQLCTTFLSTYIMIIRFVEDLSSTTSRTSPVTITNVIPTSTKISTTTKPLSTTSTTTLTTTTTPGKHHIPLAID